MRVNGWTFLSFGWTGFFFFAFVLGYKDKWDHITLIKQELKRNNCIQRMYVLNLLLSVLSVKSGRRWRCHLGRRWVERVWAQRWEHPHCRSRCFHDCCCGCWDDCRHCSHCWTHATDYTPRVHVPHVIPTCTLMSCKHSQIHKHSSLHGPTAHTHRTTKKKKTAA